MCVEGNIRVLVRLRQRLENKVEDVILTFNFAW